MRDCLRCHLPLEPGLEEWAGLHRQCCTKEVVAALREFQDCDCPSHKDQDGVVTNRPGWLDKNDGGGA